MDKEVSIGFQVHELSRMIKRSLDEHINALSLQSEEITGAQACIIGYIKREGEKDDVFQKDIEKAFHIRRSTVAETLRIMEGKGLVIRESVTHDARLKKLILTPKAIEIYEEISSEIEEVEKELTKGLSQGEKLLFLEIIDKMKKNIKYPNEKN